LTRNIESHHHETHHKNEDTKKRILRAAAEVFSEKSYHTATVTEITERAGVAKGTLYWYFPGKAELFTGMMEDVFFSLFARVEKIKEHPDLPAGERIRKVIEEYLRIFRNPLWGKAFSSNLYELAMEFRHKLEKWGKYFYRLNREVIKKGVTEGLIRDDLDDEKMAFGFIGIILEFGKLHNLGEIKYSLEEETDFLYRFLFEGMVKKSPQKDHG